MASSNDDRYFQMWIDKPLHDPATDLLTDEFYAEIQQFMGFAVNQPRTMEEDRIFVCVCVQTKVKCNVHVRNVRIIEASLCVKSGITCIWKGLCRRYKIWYCMEKMIQW